MYERKGLLPAPKKTVLFWAKAMAAMGTKGRRLILTAVGLALLGTSVYGGKFPELLKELIKNFLG